MSLESKQADITALLQRWSLGDEESLRALLPLVYGELRNIARAYLSQEAPGHTLNATGLVHEAFLRFAKNPPAAWRDRKHFYGIAARLMRQVLVDYARRRAARKRTPIVPTEAGPRLASRALRDSDYIDLDICLTRLERADPRKAQIIELRFFGGLELQEIAETVNLSVSMVKKELTLAKLSIYQEMRDGRRAPAE